VIVALNADGTSNARPAWPPQPVVGPIVGPVGAAPAPPSDDVVVVSKFDGSPAVPQSSLALGGIENAKEAKPAQENQPQSTAEALDPVGFVAPASKDTPPSGGDDIDGHEVFERETSAPAGMDTLRDDVGVAGAPAHLETRVPLHAAPTPVARQLSDSGVADRMEDCGSSKTPTAEPLEPPIRASAVAEPAAPLGRIVQEAPPSEVVSDIGTPSRLAVAQTSPGAKEEMDFPATVAVACAGTPSVGTIPDVGDAPLASDRAKANPRLEVYNQLTAELSVATSKVVDYRSVLSRAATALRSAHVNLSDAPEGAEQASLRTRLRASGAVEALEAAEAMRAVGETAAKSKRQLRTRLQASRKVLAAEAEVEALQAARALASARGGAVTVGDAMRMLNALVVVLRPAHPELDAKPEGTRTPAEAIALQVISSAAAVGGSYQTQTGESVR